MTLSSKYTSDIQLHPTQIAAIVGSIRCRGKGCNLLVFGLGNDSGLWMDINRQGHTLFLEDDARWLATARAKNPGLNGLMVDYGGVTVASALADPDTVIAQAVPPAELRGWDWDVILIDGPRGYKPDHPGRALPICWASVLRKKSTDIFVDDAQRELETVFTRRVLLPNAANETVIRRPRRSSRLVWVMGYPAV